jgi:hypothetical protein
MQMTLKFNGCNRIIHLSIRAGGLDLGLLNIDYNALSISISISFLLQFFFNFIIRYPSLAYRNTMDLQVKNIILNYIYNL